MEGNPLVEAEMSARKLKKKRRRRSPCSNSNRMITIRALAYIRQDKMCYWCGIKMINGPDNRHSQQHKKLSADHLIPVSKGGTDDEKNIVASCRKCNSERAGWKPIIIYYVRW